MKKLVTTLLLCLAVILSAYVFWDLIGYYSSDASWGNLPTHALLTGLIFAVVYCTMTIADKLDNK